MKKALYAVLLVAVLGIGFAMGRLHRHHEAEARIPLYYIDPMHPSYRASKPGKAPDCGMDLVAVYAEDLGKGQSSGHGDHLESQISGVLHIDPAAQQLYGIRRSKVEATSGQEKLRMFGKVAADENRVYRVNFGTDGYVKETHADAVGDHVHKDQRLATVYAPEFLSVVGGYLSANERTPGTVASGMKDNMAPTQNAASAQATADR